MSAEIVAGENDTIIAAQLWHSPRVHGWGPTRFNRRWVQAAWAKCSARATRDSTTPSPSRFFPHISLLSSNPEALQRFDREARAISSLSHPNVCHLYDVGAHDGINYLVMEYLEGETLGERLHKGRLTLEQRFRVGTEIC